MIIAPEHPKEAERLSALLRYEVMDSEDEAAFDELTQLAGFICGTPFALFNLLDDHRLWCKSRVGLDVHETGKDIAFCSHTILQDDIFEIPDASKDERFMDNPFVVDSPNLRFYAGIPLLSEEGLPIGTLCVLDEKARTLTSGQENALRVLAKQVVNQLELRLNSRRLERISEQRDMMLATLAHDLGSPFNGILGYARMLHEEAGDLSKEDVEELTQGIMVSSLKVYQLLDELMQWTLYNMGVTPYQLETCDVLSLLDETQTFLKEASAMKGLTVVNRLSGSLKVKGDAALIKTLFRNLITNAIKFSPTGGSIFVESHRLMPDENMVEISVADEGVGFTADTAKHLFNPPMESQRGSQGEGGHGLGLKLCRKFAELQGGTLFVDPEYSHGARVVFRLQGA